jgi:hypothetical protein
MAPCYYSFSTELRFCGRGREEPRTAPREQMNRADSMGVSLTDKNMRQNTWFGGLPDAEPCVFT